METKFNFKSQICTTREQSERLIALGLKKETADMVLLKEMVYDEQNHCLKDGEGYIIRPIDYLEGEEHRGHIPAWSLHRLFNLSPESVKQEIPYCTKDGNVELVNRDGIVTKAWGGESLYDALIKFFQWLIKEGCFNKEYLV